MMIVTSYKKQKNNKNHPKRSISVSKKLKIIKSTSENVMNRLSNLQSKELYNEIDDIIEKLRTSVTKNSDNKIYGNSLSDIKENPRISTRVLNENNIRNLSNKVIKLPSTKNKTDEQLTTNQKEEIPQQNKIVLPRVTRNPISFNNNIIENKYKFLNKSRESKTSRNNSSNQQDFIENSRKVTNHKKSSILHKMNYLNYIPYLEKTINQNKANFTRGNNKPLIKSIIDLRINWKENQEHNSRNYDYKWSLSKYGIDFNKMSAFLPVKKMSNHFEYDSEIYNKKYMFINFMGYCNENNLNIFDFVPFTLVLNFKGKNFKNNFFNLKEIFTNIKSFIGNNSSENNYNNPKFSNNYNDLFKCDVNNYKYSDNTIYIPSTHYQGMNYWLLKPTDLSGGKCIKIADTIEGLEKTIKKFYDGIDKGNKKFTMEKVQEENLLIESGIDKQKESSKRKNIRRYISGTVIVQKYIESPLLYYGRKFDIRIWVLIDYKLNVYVFREGHLKTCSTEYSIESKNKFTHITNYMLQKHNKDFQKFEEGNEVSFQDFQKCLDTHYSEKSVNVFRDILPQIKKIIELTTMSVKDKINMNHRQYCYVVLGYDFMIDTNFKAWLIEINRNPGMVESSKLIKILIPRMLDEVFRLTLDTVFEPKFEKNYHDNYKSPFHVEGYSDCENVFEFICNLNNTNSNKI